MPDFLIITGWLYNILVVAGLLVTLTWGSRDQKTVMLTIVAGSIATTLIFFFQSSDWLQTNILMIINESIVTAIILWVAFRSDRFWPIPIAAFQLIAVASHFLAPLGNNLVSHALGVMQGVWAYLQLIVLLAATYRHVKRQQMNMK